VNIYQFIEAEKACRRNVKRACELLKVSRAAFYQYLRGIPSPRVQQDAGLAAEIRSVHAESKGRYGAPRVHAELRRRGRAHSRKRVARLMRASGLQGKAAKRWKRTTIPDPAAAARADKVRRDFTADAARVNSRWCGDITYIPTWEGWLYLATVIDIAPNGYLWSVVVSIRPMAWGDWADPARRYRERNPVRISRANCSLGSTPSSRRTVSR
jgi:transposase InsO family protein